MSAADLGDAALRARILTCASVGRLLVAVDVDGTIAEIAPRPQDAHVLDEALDALRALAALPGTVVSVLSGRSMAELTDMVPLGPEVRFVGSHGAEIGEAVALDDEQEQLRARLIELVSSVAAGVPGAGVELKATGVALHVRLVARDRATALLAEAHEAAEQLTGVHARHGKEVLELSVVAAGKGRALAAIRREVAPDAVVFVGDDVTDEEALAVLEPHDLGVKVGDGDTAAEFRVPDPRAVSALLSALAEHRRRLSPGAVTR